MLFTCLPEFLPRKARVPEAARSVPPPEYSQQNKGRHATSVTKAADKDMGEIRLQNVTKSLYFKPSLLDVEMHKLSYLTKKHRGGNPWWID